MSKTALIFFLLAALALFTQSGCNSVRITVPEGATVAPGAIHIEQSAYKAAAGRENLIEATTTPTTDANVGLK